MRILDTEDFALTVFLQNPIIAPLERGSGDERGSHPSRIRIGESEISPYSSRAYNSSRAYLN